MKVTRKDAAGFAASGVLILGVFGLAALPATAHENVPATVHTVTVPTPQLPACSSLDGADDMAPCDGRDHLIYRERYWVDVDAPRVTAEQILMLGDTAYLRCAPGYDSDPDAGPCWHPAEHGTPAGIVTGDDDEPIDGPIDYLKPAR